MTATRNNFLANPSEVIAKPILALEKRQATFVHGWITCILTWTLHDKQPALALIPTHTILHVDRVIPCIVPLALAYLWDETTGDGAHCANASHRFAYALGQDASARHCFQITDVIRGHLGDLLSCPPMPNVEQVEVAFAKHTDHETGKVHETGITEDV